MQKIFHTHRPTHSLFLLSNTEVGVYLYLAEVFSTKCAFIYFNSDQFLKYVRIKCYAVKAV